MCPQEQGAPEADISLQSFWFEHGIVGVAVVPRKAQRRNSFLHRALFYFQVGWIVLGKINK